MYSQNEISNRTNLEQINILIVDDNLTICQTIRKRVAKLPYNFTIVMSGKQAITALEKRLLSYPNKLPFDLIFMDKNMPELDGIETTTQIQNRLLRQKLPKIPIISISNEVISKEICDALKIVEQIGKNFTMQIVTNIVNQYVQPSPTAQEQHKENLTANYLNHLQFFQATNEILCTQLDSLQLNDPALSETIIPFPKS
jgi:CheY-like chemotaxis protein